MFAAMRRAASGWKQSMGIAMLSGGRIGGNHEALAIHSGSFRGYPLRRKARLCAKRCMVRLLRFQRRWCHELRVCNISTMLSHRERHWRVVWTQSAVPALAGTISVD
jgi:hypothetical protein